MLRAKLRQLWNDAVSHLSRASLYPNVGLTAQVTLLRRPPAEDDIPIYLTDERGREVRWIN